MVIPDKTLFIQAANFLITVFVLNVLLIRPIREIIKKRKDLMADQMAKIEGFNGSAETKVADYEAQLAQARKEANELRSSMKDEGSAEEHKILAVAGEAASGAIQAARAEIEVEAKAAMETLTRDVGKFAEAATGKILGRA
ncbi:MAG: ATP synthase F0 subunit B [Pseudodesulfovibrio sp.]